jgi:polysaccharide pyruvyl transferase CsaB
LKVLHLIGGGDVGGAKSHVLSLVKELGKYIDVKIISFRTGIFSLDAKEMGINIQVVKSGNIIADVKTVLNIIKSEEYDIIHSHGAKANMVACVIKKYLSIPTVTTVHSDYQLDYIDNVFKKYTFGLINTMALRYIDYHIGVSQEFQNMLIKRHFNTEKIFSVYNGISFSPNKLSYTKMNFFKRFNLELTEDQIVIGILARLHPIKGIDIFLRAAKEVIKLHPSVVFFIGGDGDEKENLIKLSENLGISKNVYFLGFLNDPYEFMDVIDINILSSHSESFPYVILEGAKQKKATISSDVGGISDLIRSGANGFLFEPGNYKDLSSHMLSLVNSKELRTSMGERLYTTAKEYYSLESMCAEQLNIYKSIHSKKTNTNPCAYDIVVSGYYGFNNLGDDAMLQSIINDLSDVDPSIRFLILSKSPIQSRQKFHVNSINRMNILKLLKIMYSSKVLVYGGGNLIQDNTSTRSLLYYLFIIWLAKKFNMKTMLYGNGLGPLNKKRNVFFASKILEQVDLITIREEISYKLLNSLHLKKPRIELTADPALSIDVTAQSTSDYILKKLNIDTSRPIIGFSVRPWKNSKLYVKIISQFADTIAKEYNVLPLFIPMHYPNDLKISEEIIRLMNEKATVINQQLNISEIFSIINSLDLLVGMRLHALIFAVKLNIPVLGISYEPKVDGFLNSINQTNFINIENITYEKLIQLFKTTYENKDKYKLELANNVSYIKNQALKNPKLAIELLNNIVKEDN